MATETTTKAGGPFGWYFGTNLMTRILVGLILGGILGIVAGYVPDLATFFSSDFSKFFGDIFVRLLKMIVVPVMFFSLISGAASITPKEIGRTGGKTFLYYFITSIIAVLIGLGIALLLSPGEGLNMVGAEKAAAKVAQSAAGGRRALR